jgi:2-polyprenyl-3-methyl-5-hydroxy-6-metoxy-1,4-benzoquinol methylase
MTDPLLFHLAPDIYHRRQARLHQERFAPELYGLWEEALTLPGVSTLEESFLAEIQEYFGLSHEEAKARLDSGAEHFAEHFARIAPNRSDPAALARVYEETDLEIFELAEWHARRFADGPVNYALSLRAALALGGRRYLDYGSGIGSGAILFAKNGFEVTLADVSGPMLAFAQWRFRKRGLTCRAVNLMNEPLGTQVWDIITLLDVLEHVADPLAVMASLRPHLSTGAGLLVARAPFDDERPQHIPHDMRTPSRFSALGFSYAWDKMGRRGLPIALRVSSRGRFGNLVREAVDDKLLGVAASALGLLRAARIAWKRGTDPK